MNLADESVEVYRAPSETGYREADVARRGQDIAPAAFPDCRLAVGDLLG